MSTACESKYTDQSILNSVFHSHASLPRGFNMQIAGDFMDANSSAIFHFVGEPKPWSHNAMTGRGKEPARRNATARWQRQCASVMAK
jgi:lipopolysaccharide biosynthesis glycosyltransferase